MPLGDSITGSPGCWRAMLWNGLAAAGIHNIDFVGSLSAPHCKQSHDADNEGHGGFLVTTIAREKLLTSWLESTNPDIVLMHLGTNDVWNHKSSSEILSAYTTLVDQMRAKNPRIIIVVAQLIPMSPRDRYICETCQEGVVHLNAAISTWAKKISTAKSPVIVTDQWTGFELMQDTSDGVHPTESGNKKIAENWQKTLLKILPQK